jgi:hypothetical protein
MEKNAWTLPPGAGEWAYKYAVAYPKVGPMLILHQDGRLEFPTLEENPESIKLAALTLCHHVSHQFQEMRSALQMWHDAMATGRNEPLVIARDATKHLLNPDTNVRVRFHTEMEA